MKFHAIYAEKSLIKKYKTKFMGHLFQVEWLVETSQWVFIWFIMEKEIGKGNGKGFGKVRGIIGISFMKITEISRKGR